MRNGNIYGQHDKAFANVSAFVITKGGDRVATIALKFPRDGAGRLYAYVHWLGEEMVRGFATGGGYDKRSAACSAAAFRMPKGDSQGARLDFVAALRRDDGLDWSRQLERAGFTVLQAV